MFMKIFVIGLAGLVTIHGLIHLIGFRVYAQGARVAEMPFKTTFFNGSLDLGILGTRVYGCLWLLPTLGFVLTGVGFFLHTHWWQPVLLASALVSLALTVMDWKHAFAGALVDLALVGLTLLVPVAAHLGITF